LKEQRRWRRVLITSLVGLVVVYVMLRWFEHRQIYFPTREFVADAEALARPFENVQFKTSDGVELHGWFLPVATNSPRRHLAVLICHGNGGNISHRLDLCRLLLEGGVAVFVFDYRGYGHSRGTPGEEGTYLDAQAAHRWLSDKGFRGEHIVAFGESLGGGVAAELALRETLGGLVLQSSFTSIPDVGAELFPWLPVRWISTVKYDTQSKLPRMHIPVMVMHSRADTLIGFHHGEANFATANEPKLFWELQGDHNDSLSSDQGFADGIERFLQMVDTTFNGCR